jgi:hypothetical protein
LSYQRQELLTISEQAFNHNILHICSINTNGLQQSEKRQRLIEWSKQQQCNILLMQETHFSQIIENKLIQDFKGSHKSIYLFEESVSFVHIIGSIHVY